MVNREALVQQMKNTQSEMDRLYKRRDKYDINSVEYRDIDDQIAWCEENMNDLEDAMWSGLETVCEECGQDDTFGDCLCTKI